MHLFKIFTTVCMVVADTVAAHSAGIKHNDRRSAQDRRDLSKASGVIVGALQLITQETRMLGRVIEEWDGTGGLGAMDVQEQNDVLVELLEASVDHVRDHSHKLNLIQSLPIKGTIERLIQVTRHAMEILESRCNSFKEASLENMAYDNLLEMHSKSTEFSDMVITKLRFIAKKIAQSKAQELNDLFDHATDMYRSPEDGQFQCP